MRTGIIKDKLQLVGEWCWEKMEAEILIASEGARRCDEDQERNQDQQHHQEEVKKWKRGTWRGARAWSRRRRRGRSGWVQRRRRGEGGRGWAARRCGR